jgi:uncharacterized protein YjcR
MPLKVCNTIAAVIKKQYYSDGLLGLLQKDVAEKLGVSVYTILNWER